MDDKWLSKGIGEVRSVLGYPGNILPSRRTHLIMIVGYEQERATGVVQKIEPNSMSLGYGRSGSATTKKDHDANEHYMNIVRQMATSFSDNDVSLFEIPCDNPYKTHEAIKNEIVNNKDMNIILAPMNNKISTVGAAWVCFENKDVQICYAQTLHYNYFNYSTPGSKCYVFDLTNPTLTIE